jgi:hypothetical protein
LRLDSALMSFNELIHGGRLVRLGRLLLGSSRLFSLRAGSFPVGGRLIFTLRFRRSLFIWVGSLTRITLFEERTPIEIRFLSLFRRLSGIFRGCSG